MKKIITALLIGAVTCSALPAAAAHKHTFKSGKLEGVTLEYNRWSEARCQVLPTYTMKDKRSLLWNCIGRVGEAKYAKTLAEYYTNKTKPSSRDKEVIMRASLALAHPDIKWKSDKWQKHIDNLKIAGIAWGAVSAAALIAAGITGGVPLLLNGPNLIVHIPIGPSLT